MTKCPMINRLFGNKRARRPAHHLAEVCLPPLLLSVAYLAFRCQQNAVVGELAALGGVTIYLRRTECTAN